MFVLYTFNQRDMQYVILTPQQLLEWLDVIHSGVKSLQSYLWVTKGPEKQCWETRDLKKGDTGDLILGNGRIDKVRDFSEFLNGWDAIIRR